MGKWMRKMGRWADDQFGDDDDEEQVPHDALQAVDEFLQQGVDGDDRDIDSDGEEEDEDSPRWQRRLQAFARKTSPEFYEAFSECHAVASDTVEICESVSGINNEVVDFCTTVKSTLHSTSRDTDASILETLKDMADGDKVRHAASLATELTDAAKRCVVKSVSMMDHLEKGLNSLPRFARRAIRRRGQRLLASEDGEEKQVMDRNTQLVQGIDQDLAEIQLVIQAIKELNLVTAFQTGMHAFESLSGKTDKTKELFQIIHKFSQDVCRITQALKEMDISAIIDTAPDLCRCLVMTDQMRQLSLGAGKLMPPIIDLFEHTAERVSGIWQALSYAKDCMQACIDYCTGAKRTCREAFDESSQLVSTSRSVCDQLGGTTRSTSRGIGDIDINPRTLDILRNLASDNGDISRAIGMANTVDDRVIDCVRQVVEMIDKVTNGFSNLPEVLTDGVDKDRDGYKDDDPEIPDVEPDIQDLEEAKRSLEECNLLEAARQGIQGFEGVINKADLIQNLLDVVIDFTEQSHRTIDAFMHVWDLESAQSKIMEMCRLVSLGELMRKFADQIERLVRAIVALLKAALDKYNNLDWSDVGDLIGDVVGEMKDKLKFWRK